MEIPSSQTKHKFKKIAFIYLLFVTLLQLFSDVLRTISIYNIFKIFITLQYLSYKKNYYCLSLTENHKGFHFAESVNIINYPSAFGIHFFFKYWKKKCFLEKFFLFFSNENRIIIFTNAVVLMIIWKWEFFLTDTKIEIN